MKQTPPSVCFIQSSPVFVEFVVFAGLLVGGIVVAMLLDPQLALTQLPLLAKVRILFFASR